MVWFASKILAVRPHQVVYRFDPIIFLLGDPCGDCIAIYCLTWIVCLKVVTITSHLRNASLHLFDLNSSLSENILGYFEHFKEYAWCSLSLSFGCGRLSWLLTYSQKKKKPFKIINSNHSPHTTSPLLNHVPEHQIHTSLKCFHFSPSRATTCRFLGLYLYSCAILLKLSWNSEQSFTFVLNCVHCPTIFTLSTYSARLGYEQVYLLAGQHPHYWNVASLHKGHIVVDIQVHEINEIAYIYILSQYNFIMHNLLHSIKSSREWMSESS